MFSSFKLRTIALAFVALSLTLSVLATVLVPSTLSVAASSSSSPITTSLNAYEITTRGDLSQPVGVQGYGYGNRYPLLDIEHLYNSCPDETVIVVHGWALNKTMAKERFDRVKMSLEHNNYNISLVGFSWDSDMEWLDAKYMAKKNGPRLAHFILDYMSSCKYQYDKEVDVRLIAHSLGSRVILSTLDNLNNNTIWNNSNFKIASVHLMGAAVDNEEVSKTSIDHFNFPTWCHDPAGVKDAYGIAIEKVVIDFYNLHNPEDNVLQFVYPSFECLDRALGEDGRQEVGITPPLNYNETNVTDEIMAISDADGVGGCDPNIICEPDGLRIGDNHAGYFGFRNSADISRLDDDGAINVVVRNWRGLP